MSESTPRVSPQRLRRPAPSGPNQTLSLRFVLNAIRQWWRLATPVGLLLAFCAATLVFLFFEQMFEASALIEIKDNAPYLAFPEPDNSKRFVNTQLQLMQHKLVLGPVLSRAEIARMPEVAEQEDATQWLREQFHVVSLGDSELYGIRFAGPDPKNAADIVNAITEEYFKLWGQEDTNRTRRIIEVLKQEEDRRASEVKRLRENVRTLAIENTGYDPWATDGLQRGPSESSPLDALETHLVTTEVELTILQARLKVAEDSETPEVPSWQVDQAVDMDPELQHLEASVKVKQQKLAEIASKSRKGVDDPLYRQLEAEIKLDEEAKETYAAGLREDAYEDLKKLNDGDHEAQIAGLKETIEYRNTLLDTLETKRNAEIDEKKTSRGISFDLLIANADLKQADAVLGKIRERKVQLDAERRALDRITLRSAASPPTSPVEVLPFKKMLMAALAGLLLPFGLAVLWEFWCRRVSDTCDLQQQSMLPVVGEIARLPMRARGRGGFSEKSGNFAMGMFEESIDSLRTNLVLAEDLQGMRILVVTSATNHEGKTSVAAQLAVSLSRASGKQTLLIDGDMRRPDIHKVFEISLEPGLAEVLGGECSLEDAIVTDWSDHVHLLPAGKLRFSPHKLLGNGSVTSLLESIPETYRYVVIDTPPVLAASETLVLAKAADASLICAMQDVSRIDQVRAACERLTAAGSHTVGTVLNGVPTKRYAYRYGSYAYSRR